MIYLLDASAIINQPNFEFSSGNECVMTPECFDELREHSVKLRAENALQNHEIRLVEADQKFGIELNHFLKQNGISKLSKPDLSVLALAFEFQSEKKEFKVMSDDYDIQNVLALKKIPFEAVLHGTIKKVFKFQKKCRGCGRIYPADFPSMVCEDCHSQLRNLPKTQK